jgi:hypothetical protein
MHTRALSLMVVLSLGVTAAAASDFRIAPKPDQVASLNDIELCKHDYVRELAFVQAEVKKRYLDCTAILTVLVEQKRQEQQARLERENKRLAAEERAKVEQAAREREAAEQERLRAEAARIEQQRRRLVELQQQQLELQRMQAKAADRAARAAQLNSSMNMITRGLQMMNGTGPFAPTPAPAPSFNSLDCTTYNNGWNTPKIKCRPSPFIR